VFGRYGGDISYTDNAVSVRLERSPDISRYVRSCGKERAEKILSSDKGTVIINPVEPVNLPLPLTRHLEIWFPRIALLPGAFQRLFLSFPLEIGVLLEAGGDIHVLDLFSTTRTKYSLYGSPDAGLITRWHKSDLHTAKPVVSRYEEGVLELAISNSSSETVEVKRTVLDSDSMHLFYGDVVEMAADMEVFSPMIARTTCRNVPPQADMERCIELYTAKKIPVVQKKGFLMEFGVA
jgi:hypothetical protein